MHIVRLYVVLLLLLQAGLCKSQDNDTTARHRKNIVRYNLSGAILFGIDNYVVMGYERLVRPSQSFSINMGWVSLPQALDINTDSFNIGRDQKRNGFNLSIDYRFYLSKENKYPAPHGLYIGPYYSFNKFNSEITWDHKNSSANNHIGSKTNFTINTVGFELGYQLILWKRFAVDLLLIGPGVGIYSYKATFEGNIDPATKEQLLEGLKQVLTAKFPGMNYVFSDKEFNASGALKTGALGYRYIVQVGYNF